MVVEPVAAELACVFRVEVGTLAVAHVVAPVTAVLVTVGESEGAGAMGCVVRPLAVVLSAIGPLHGPAAVTEPAQPLARINRTGGVSVILSDYFCCELVLRVDRFFRLVDSEVLRFLCRICYSRFPKSGALNETPEELLYR